MSTLPYTLWQRKNKQWNTSRKHFGAKMSPLLIAQIFYLLTLTNAAPPDLVADVERVEVIAGAKDILLPCRSKVFLVSLQENNLTILVAWSIIFSNNIFTFYHSFFFSAFHFKININKPVSSLHALDQSFVHVKWSGALFAALLLLADIFLTQWGLLYSIHIEKYCKFSFTKN